MRDLNGFPAILDLMTSEYPVIQHMSLVALHRATEDGKISLKQLKINNISSKRFTFIVRA